MPCWLALGEFMENIEQLRPFFRRMADRLVIDRGFLPASIDREDLVQEALTLAVKLRPTFKNDGRASFSTFMYKRVIGLFSTMIAKSHFGPSAATRAERQKKGGVIDYGEVSLQELNGWENWLAAQPEEADKEINFVNVPLGKGGLCLQEVRAKIANLDDSGISWVESREKWHVEVKVCSVWQFVGQFKDKGDALQAKKKFLESFFDIVLDSLSETETAKMAICTVRTQEARP